MKKLNTLLTLCMLAGLLLTQVSCNKDCGNVRKKLRELEDSMGLADLKLAAEKLGHAGQVALADGDLVVQNPASGFTWQGKVEQEGKYQLWVTYFSDHAEAHARLKFNGEEKSKPVQYLGAETFKKFYLTDGTEIEADELEENRDKIEAYYFREYWGSFDLTDDVELEMLYQFQPAGNASLKIHEIELVRERDFAAELEPLFFAGIDFYDYQTSEDGFVRNYYKHGADPATTSSVATCGQGLMAYSINHHIGRDPQAEAKALRTLRLFNNKHETIHPRRHHTGWRHHFINIRTGESNSEFSTIDTCILVAGALMARNTFDSDEIRAEADELWSSIDWTSAIADLENESFHMTGKSIDGVKDEITILFSEYIMLAWFCQKYEDQVAENPRQIMTPLEDVTKSVFMGRVVPSCIFGGMLPSFHVQFPFYMTDLCGDELFFSYQAAQGWADRMWSTQKYKNRTAWGVSPGSTPKRGYSVDAFYNDNKEDVVTPRIIAGFIPTNPVAVDDLRMIFANHQKQQVTRFGRILPRWSPATPGWQSRRIAGVDYSSWLYGMAAYHPEVGLDFFKEKMQMTFEHTPGQVRAVSGEETD
ncbi:hypothetical protein [Persicirhabdus sediminis]|uniref:Glycoamylase-like domain-containing protein n=1 Tax=Persicirhabdus sediminis TaxID=454144 RepID=A0A8J7MCS7_9BACT|nr:hypothetical protein [Persicirhabdus sediminis]MBK1790156.1 hypothetical protein [Persicirhabdus sediminis]